MLDVFLPIIIIIGLGYAFHILLVRSSKSRPHSSKQIPVHRLSGPSGGVGSTGIWKLERHGITLSASTTVLNALPKNILDKRSGRLRPLLRALYDLGSALGLAGGVAAIAGTVWALQEVWKAVWEEARLHATEMAAEEAVKVVKRSLGEASASSSISPGSGGLQPLVSEYVLLLCRIKYRSSELIRQLPGVTIPWSHMPTVVLALLVNQLVHELGHAMSAAV